MKNQHRYEEAGKSAHRFLLSILNGGFLCTSVAKRYGGYFEYKPMFIEQLPVPKNSNENLFSEFAGEELQNEKEIDRKVYELYGLTKEEISFIEKNNICKFQETNRTL